MSRSRISILIIGVVLISHVAATPQVMGQSELTGEPVCTGRYKGTRKPSHTELTDILKKHADWLKDGRASRSELANDPRRANLCEADLTGAYLAMADLRRADLRDSNLEATHLDGTHLDGAHLTGADLAGAPLAGAFVRNALLDGAHLNSAHMPGADLKGADLTGASLAGC